MTQRISHWIDGAVVAGTSGRVSPVYNPATGLRTGEVDLASAAEVNTVVAGARAAAAQWRGVSLSKRSAVMFAFRELLHSSADGQHVKVEAATGESVTETAANHGAGGVIGECGRSMSCSACHV